jgi:hypothetical protein
VDDYFCRLNRTLPPGIPLDLDIVEHVLRTWKTLEDFKEQVAELTALPEAVQNWETHFADQLELCYMETIWRKIKLKTK